MNLSMDLNDLLDKYEKRRQYSEEWMYKQDKGIILNDEFLSPYDSSTKVVLEELQRLYDEYEKKFKQIPPIGMFSVARQKALLKQALKTHMAVNMEKLL